LQACSAVDRALEFWIFFVASRHFCLAAATPLPEPAVVDVAVDEVDEVDDDELPHALSLDPPIGRAVDVDLTRSRV
jgi:hypothetical protein